MLHQSPLAATAACASEDNCTQFGGLCCRSIWPGRIFTSTVTYIQTLQRTVCIHLYENEQTPLIHGKLDGMQAIAYLFESDTVATERPPPPPGVVRFNGPPTPIGDGIPDAELRARQQQTQAQIDQIQGAYFQGTYFPQQQAGPSPSQTSAIPPQGRGGRGRAPHQYGRSGPPKLSRVKRKAPGSGGQRPAKRAKQESPASSYTKEEPRSPSPYIKPEPPSSPYIKQESLSPSFFVQEPVPYAHIIEESFRPSISKPAYMQAARAIPAPPFLGHQQAFPLQGGAGVWLRRFWDPLTLGQ